jgi:hypothetical protein
VNLLIVDHHFDQDIDAIRRGAGSHAIRVLAAERFGRIARRHFPAEVFSSSLGEQYGFPQYAESRERHYEDVRNLLREIYATYAFDVLIVPSDVILSFRPFARVAREMGIPFVVLQKETTISPHTMVNQACVIGKWLPFGADLMLACSDNQKAFWLNAGAAPERIIVTGQPRFDVYYRHDQRRSLADMGIDVDPSLPTVMFLSYDVGAYSPEGPLTPTWVELRGETEKVVTELALEGKFNLLVKTHPQQQGMVETRARMRKLAGEKWRRTVHLVAGHVDFRQLVPNVDVVVGFQTTAMFEAMAAGKRVIYTFWGDATRRYVSDLIPLHEMRDALEIATSADGLRSMLMEPKDWSPESRELRLREAEHQLGPLDGKATNRAVTELEKFVSAYLVTDESRAKRIVVRREAAKLRGKVLPRGAVQALGWSIGALLLPVLYPAWRVVRRLLKRKHEMGPIESYRERIRQGLRESLDDVRFGVRAMFGGYE